MRNSFDDNVSSTFLLILKRLCLKYRNAHFQQTKSNEMNVFDVEMKLFR